MASKTDPKITRRQVDNLRTKSMRFADHQLSRLRMSTLGKPAIETCECGNEYELFPNQPLKLDASQVNAIKFDVDKIYPGLAEEDLDKATKEPGTKEELNERLADMITEDGVLTSLIDTNYQEAIKVRDMLNELLPDDVVSIKKAS